MTNSNALRLAETKPAPRRSGNGSALDSNATVPKAVGLIQVKIEAGNLNLQDQKMINALLFYSHDNIIDNDAVHETTMQDLREYLGSHESNDRVRKTLKNLASVVLDFDYFDTDGDRKWGEGSLITVSGHEVGDDGLVTYTWPHWLRPLLAEPAKWARLSMMTVRSFQSKYSLRLYENLESVANLHVSEWLVTVDDLRTALGAEGKLKSWGALYERAIKPALDEVNALADFNVDMHIARRRGRKVVAVRFVTTKKKSRKLRELNGRMRKSAANGQLVVRPETIKKAKQYAAGMDIYMIEQEWRAHAEKKGQPKNPDGAFLNFVKVWVKNRQGKLF